MKDSASETERIRKAYGQRDVRVPAGRYSLFNKANLYIVQRREWEILKCLRARGVSSLENMKVLDVGCGEGMELINLLRYSAKPENLCGIDLLPDRIAKAQRLSPNIEFCCGDATRLPYPDGTFDMVLQFTAFTSILDASMKKSIAGEMRRVLKPGGFVLWYDYHMNNPSNPDVRGVGKKEIFRLFAGCDIRLSRVTLAPPIARALAPCSCLVCHMLEKFKLLNTHYLGAIVKR